MLKRMFLPWSSVETSAVSCRCSGHKSLAEHLLTLSRDPNVSAKAIAQYEESNSLPGPLQSNAVGVPPLTEIITAHLRAADAAKLSNAVIVNLHASPGLGNTRACSTKFSCLPGSAD